MLKSVVALVRTRLKTPFKLKKVQYENENVINNTSTEGFVRLLTTGSQG